jgi:hypothetical protein
MRSADGKHFDDVLGVKDRDPVTGLEFVANHLDCSRTMVVGDCVRVGGTVICYRGEDSLGRSIFTGLGETVVDALTGGSR